MRPAALACLMPLLVSACEPSPQQAERSSAAAAPAGIVPRRNLPIGKGFDFYVLSLSWSPSYCAAEGEDANRQQCASGRPYAFIVHGLWPQFERGYPADCPVDQPRVPDDEIEALLPLMPSASLIGHQWRKHGSCSGLPRQDYFDVLRAAHERVAVPAAYRRLDDHLNVDPDEVERDFLAANPGLAASGIAVTCDRRFLREVRICMTKTLEFRSCEEVDAKACRSPTAIMPPVRGG